MKFLSSIFLFLCFFLGFFSNLDGLAKFFQIISVLCLFISACCVFILGGVKKRNLNAFEILILIVGVVSLGVGLGNTDNLYLSFFPLIFLICIISILILVRFFLINEVLKILSLAYATIILFVLLTNFQGFIFSLGAGEVYGKGLVRFQPLDLHPNLTGFIFSGGVIVFLILCQASKGRERLFNILFCIMCVLFVLAASARAGLLASFLTVIVVLIRSFSLNYIVRKKNIIISFVSLFMVLFNVFFEVISDYLINILEFNSDTRGVDSGGTGRFELWEMGLNHVLNNSLGNLIFGEGLRSSSAEVIGFSTESSYITILIEHGVLLGGIMILSIILIFFSGFLKFKSNRLDILIVFSIVMYAIIQSVFNRYLIAIGNPFSVFLLFSFCYSFLIFKK